MSLHPQDRRNERELRIMASAIYTQEMLDKLLAGSAPDMRQAMIERLRPHLRFTPAAEDIEVKDCPHCGFRRGTVVPHECDPA